MEKRNRDHIYVCWDLKSCKLRQGYDAIGVHVAIKSAMMKLGFFGPINIEAVAVEGQLPRDILFRLSATGITIKYSEGWQESNSMIKNSITRWRYRHKPPAVVVIISCDKDYQSVVKILRVEGFNTCIMYIPSSTSERLTCVPNFSLVWDDVLGKASGVDPRDYGFPMFEVPVRALAEVSPSLIAVHPSQRSVAVTVGSDLRVFDLIENCPVTLVDDSRKGPSRKGSIRAIRYGPSGKLFVSAGDDKRVKIWSATESWRCLYTLRSKREVSAVAIRSDDSHVCYADKRGVVWVVELDGINADKVLPANKKSARLLFHYASIITCLDFSPDGRYILSADDSNDNKIRVTVFPKKPLEGAREIQSFCLGHTEFITCIAFVGNPELTQGYLMSGSGDSTVRLWDFSSGSLLDTCEVSTMAGHLETNESEPPAQVAVTEICTIPNSSIAAVAIRSFQGILLLSCDVSARTLSIKKVIHIPGESFIPTSISLSQSTKFLWMVSGASNPPGRVRVISCIEAEPTLILGDGQIPGGTKLVEHLQGKVQTE